jgi:hypothetical protein
LKNDSQFIGVVVDYTKCDSNRFTLVDYLIDVVEDLSCGGRNTCGSCSYIWNVFFLLFWLGSRLNFLRMFVSNGRRSVLMGLALFTKWLDFQRSFHKLIKKVMEWVDKVGEIYFILFLRIMSSKLRSTVYGCHPLLWN